MFKSLCLNRQSLIPYCFFISLIPYHYAQATSVNITVNGSDQAVTTTAGQVVQFDISVICAGLLEYIDGTGQSKGNKSKSEVEWSFINNSSETIRLTGVGISWNCIVDADGDCAIWGFDYLKFDDPVEGAKKIYEDKNPTNSPFSVTDFDSNVGNSNEHKNPYLDVRAGETVEIDEIEFVDSDGDKIDNIKSGTQVEFTATWRDDQGNTYPQTFTVTWP